MIDEPREPAGDRHDGRVRLTYIIGCGRSGSTLLSRLMEHEGYRAIGETRLVADELSRRLPCGCGLAHESCPLWGPILDQLEKRDGRAAFRNAIHSRPQRLRGFVTGGGFGSDFEQALDAVRLVYTELGADGKPLVDESKTPWLGFLLATQPWADVRFVEIVRSPRDVIDSWSKDKSWIDSKTREDAAKLWLNRCVTSNAVRLRLGSPWLRRPFSYLVNEPDQCLTEIVGRPQTVVRRENGKWEFDSPATHIFRSNPDKMRTGTDSLRPTHVRPAEPAADAGQFEKIACQYWNKRLAGNVSISRAW